MFTELVLWYQMSRTDWVAIEKTNQRVRETLKRAEESDKAHAAWKEWDKKQQVIRDAKDRELEALKKTLRELEVRQAAATSQRVGEQGRRAAEGK